MQEIQHLGEPHYLVLPVLQVLDRTLRGVLVGEGDKGEPLVLLCFLILRQPHLSFNSWSRDVHYNSVLQADRQCKITTRNIY